MAASFKELLDAYRERGAALDWGGGEREREARKAQSLAISQLRDAQLATQEALEAGNYQAWLKARSSQSDSLLKYMVDMQKNSNDNRAKVDAEFVGRLTEIDKFLDSEATKDVFKAIKTLRTENRMGMPGTFLVDERGRPEPQFQNAVIAQMRNFPDTPEGRDDTRALLRLVGSELHTKMSVAEVDKALRDGQPEGNWVTTKLTQAKEAESRVQNDKNALRIEKAANLERLRKGYVGAAWLKKYAKGGSPVASMMGNPGEVQSIYNESVPEGRRSRDFEISERERQRGGSLSQRYQDLIESDKFKKWARQLQLSSQEYGGFVRALAKGSRAVDRYINRRMDWLDGGGDGRSGVADVGRRGAPMGPEDDETYDPTGIGEQTPKEQEEADKQATERRKESEVEMFGSAEMMPLAEYKSRVRKITTRFGGFSKIPQEWVDYLRRTAASQLFKRRQEGGDPEEIEYFVKVIEYFPTKSQADADAAARKKAEEEAADTTLGARPDPWTAEGEDLISVKGRESLPGIRGRPKRRGSSIEEMREEARERGLSVEDVVAEQMEAPGPRVVAPVLGAPDPRPPDAELSRTDETFLSLLDDRRRRGAVKKELEWTDEMRRKKADVDAIQREHENKLAMEKIREAGYKDPDRRSARRRRSRIVGDLRDQRLIKGTN